VAETCPDCGAEIPSGEAVCPACGAFHTLVTPKTERTLADRYLLLGLLGRGGMGAVYLAQDLQLGQRIAVKVLPAELSHDLQAVAGLKREVLLARELHHDNIAAVYNFETDVERSLCFIVMEYVDSADLHTILSRHKATSESRGLPLDTVLHLAGQMADALDYAHSKGVIHRDVKPKNILLTKKGAVKVTDFGIARRLAETMSSTFGAKVAGTLPYMPPEQIRGEKIDRRADVYAFAATLYELLTGRPPFWRGDIAYQVINKPPPEPEGLPESVSKVLLRGLAKVPEARFESAGALYAALAGDQFFDDTDAMQTLSAYAAEAAPEVRPIAETPLDGGRLLEEAETAAGEGDFARALALLERAMRQTPTETIRERIFSVQRRQQEYYDHIEAGDKAAEAGGWEKALTEYERAAAVRRSPMLAERIARCKRGIYEETVARARRALREKRYSDAVDLAKAAAELVEDPEEARTVMAEVREAVSEYEALMERAKAARRKRRWEEAEKAAADALAVLPSDRAAELLLSEARGKRARFEELLDRAGAAADACNHAEAAELAEEALRITDDEEARALLKRCRHAAAVGVRLIEVRRVRAPRTPRAVAPFSGGVAATARERLYVFPERGRHDAPPDFAALSGSPHLVAAAPDGSFFAAGDAGGVSLVSRPLLSLTTRASVPFLPTPERSPWWPFRGSLFAFLFLLLTGCVIVLTTDAMSHPPGLEALLLASAVFGSSLSLLLSLPALAARRGHHRVCMDEPPVAVAFAEPATLVAASRKHIFVLRRAGALASVCAFFSALATVCISLFLASWLALLAFTHVDRLRLWGPRHAVGWSVTDASWLHTVLFSGLAAVVLGLLQTILFRYAGRWRLATRVAIEPPAEVVAVGQTGSSIAAATARNVRIYAMPHMSLLRTFGGRGVPPMSAAVSPDAAAVVVLGDDGELESWKATSSTSRRLPAPRGTRYVALSADGRLILTAGESIAVLETASGTILARKNMTPACPPTIASDGLVATASTDAIVTFRLGVAKKS